MAMSQMHSLKDRIASHPKLVGMLFATLLFLSKAGAAAGAKINYAGP
ncbi:DUF7503 family protein [Halomicrobium salinisoli]|nr:hypothetical protein [Halomicrobium salinisoli]